MARENRRTSRDKGVFIKNVRIFDGIKVLQENCIHILEGKIARIGKNLNTPEDAMAVDGAGCTLLPGLFDSHVHVLNNEKKS